MNRSYFLSLAIALVCAGAARGQGASTAWVGFQRVATPVGGDAGFGNVFLSTQAAAADGGVVVAGTMRADAVDFHVVGSGPAEDAVSRFIYVARYARDGQLRWVRTFYGNEYTSITGVAVASNGDIVVGGAYAGSETIETASGPVQISSGSSLKGVLFRLRDDGVTLSARIVGPDVYGVAFDGSDNLYYWGHQYGSWDLDPGPGEDPVDMGFSLGSTYVVKLSPTDVYLDGFIMGADSPAILFGMAVDPKGNLYLSGLLYRASYDFDPGRGLAVLNSTYDSGFVLKRSRKGKLDWVRLLEALPDPRGGAGRVEARQIAYDARNDAVVVGGQFYGTVDFRGGRRPQTTASTNPSSFDVFATSIDAKKGSENWTRTYNAFYLVDLDVDAAGRIALIGLTYDGAVDLSPNAAGGDVSGKAFLAVLDSAGSVRWSGGLESTGFIYTGSVAFNRFGELYYGSSTSGTVDFDPGPGVADRSDNLFFAGEGKLVFP